jgi:CubicO group peptidase (beta-lactamase class C family)
MRVLFDNASTRAACAAAFVLCIGAAGHTAAAQELPRQQRVEPTLVSRTFDLAVITDKVFAPWNSTHSPGCAVGISQGGKTRLIRGYGMSDLANGIAITPTTVLESGSVAKQFTATAVLLLMQDGKLSLEDDVRKYLPELPVYGRPITVRHLLTHTSGLREWSNLMAWQGWPRGTRVHTQSDVFDVITRQKALNYPVGDYYSYTNSGFLLLRTLVERVSGKPFATFSEERIFRPLGMANTTWRDDYTRIVPGLAQAYGRRGDEWRLDMPFDNVIGAGGLLTTIADWLRWNEALTSKALGPAVGDSITRRMKLTSGLEIQYALGVIDTRYRGLREVSHSGSTAGYSTFLARYPERDNLSIAVMCNAAGAGATAYTHAIVDGMFVNLPRPAAFDTVAGDAATMRSLPGIYRDTRTNVTVVIAGGPGGVRRGNAALRALADSTLLSGNTRIRLDRAKDGSIVGFKQATADGDTVRYMRVADAQWTPTTAELASLAGKYRSDEIGVTFSVASIDGGVTISPRAGVADTARPLYREKIATGTREGFTNGGEAVWFIRDAKGRVTEMHFGSARVWDFVSTRVP